MAHSSPGELNTEAGVVSAPANPKAVNVQIGVRWAAVTWQPPSIGSNRPVEDYLLAISPGHQTIRFDSRTTQTVLIALAPAQPYTIFVAARNAAGSSGWVSSPPVQLDYMVDAASQRNELINAELFEDLLLFDDATLSDWLADVDDVDLELAIATTPHSLRERIFSCIQPSHRASLLREKLAPPPPTQIVRRSEIVPPPMARPIMPRPEVVIEIPPSPPKARLPWAVALIPLLLVVFALIWLLRPLLPDQENAELKATGDALVALRVTSEVAPTQSPAMTPTEQSVLLILAPTSALTSGEPAQAQNQQQTTPAVPTSAAYAEPAVDLLNVRSGPGEVYGVREILPAGTQVELQGRNEEGNWVYVATDSVEGWVASWLLTIVGDPGELAVRLPPPTPAPMPELLALALITSTSQPAIEVADVQVLATDTVVAAAAPTPTSNTAAPLATAAASSPCLLGGYFWLIHPVEITVYDQVSFRWGFSAPLPQECGFEVSVWRVDGAPRGVHDAVVDNRNGVVKLLPQNEYRLDVPFMHNLPSIAGSGDYLWTVSIVEIEPTYRSFNRSATPSRFYLDLPSR